MPKRIPMARTPYSEPSPRRPRRDPSELTKLYGSASWKRFRHAIRAERVLCERCQAEGLLVEGDTVHHKRDPRDEPELTYDPNNVELLCKACHNSAHKRQAPRSP